MNLSRSSVELKSKPLQKCELCGSTSPAIKCQDCNGKLFCPSCDDMFHRHPKRQNHERKVRETTGLSVEFETNGRSSVSFHCRPEHASPAAAQGRAPAAHRSTASEQTKRQLPHGESLSGMLLLYPVLGDLFRSNTMTI